MNGEARSMDAGAQVQTRAHRSFVHVPADWEAVAHRKVVGFVTSETWRRPDGRLVTWTSRAHRKGPGRHAAAESTWWAPRALGWWVAVLFIIGSACFAIGPAPGYLSWVGYQADTVTFFVGSIFFTSAALCQYIQTVRVPRVIGADGARVRTPFLGFEPRRIDFWAAGVQFVGTLFFNVTTFNAMRGNPDYQKYIWTPDWRGSICFLIASELAFAEVGHRTFSWIPRSRSWRITALNLLGSVFFGVSAIASYTSPTTGAPVSVFWTNLGTFAGAICFLVGAVLLMPERTHPDTEPKDDHGPARQNSEPQEARRTR